MLVFGAAQVPHVDVLLGIPISEVHIMCRPAQVHGASHACVGFGGIETT